MFSLAMRFFSRKAKSFARYVIFLEKGKNFACNAICLYKRKVLLATRFAVGKEKSLTLQSVPHTCAQLHLEEVLFLQCTTFCEFQQFSGFLYRNNPDKIIYINVESKDGFVMIHRERQFFKI